MAARHDQGRRLEQMMQEVAERAQQDTGLAIRWEKYSVAEFVRKVAAAAPEDDPWSSYPLLSKAAVVGEGGSLRLLGTTLQKGHGLVEEWNSLRAKCWAAYHSRVRFWRVKSHVLHKLRMLQIAIFLVLKWCTASRYWNKAELQSVRTLQLRMCRRVLRLWPRENEAFPAFQKRTARWIDTLLSHARVPRWDVALAASWWMLGDHMACLSARDPTRWVAEALSWRDASCRTTHGQSPPMVSQRPGTTTARSNNHRRHCAPVGRPPPGNMRQGMWRRDAVAGQRPGHTPGRRWRRHLYMPD